MATQNGIVSGKLAFVTGAGSGIGRATCEILSREGATVIAADINVKAAEETIKLLTNAENLSLYCDVSNSNSVSDAAEAILKKYKKPATIIVNAAGIIKGNKFLDIKEEDYDKILAVNLKGTFLVNQHFAKALVKEKLSGSIINVASIAGVFGCPGHSDYAASKGGVIALSFTVARELAAHNIRVNSVLPGMIETPLISSLSKEAEWFKKMAPLKRLGTPSEIAETIVFLSSDRSSYTTGGAIQVSGGY